MLERTRRLQRLTAHLSTALRMTEVAKIVISESASALDAATAGLWRMDTAATELVT